ncbi:MAG: thiol peroxidase [Woeseiaceae bacterium]|nr:thiol peroxidase [Woeseiaceae bacterium]
MASISYNGKTYPVTGDLPNVGSRAPDIMLVNTELQNVSLSNWSGKRKIMNIFVSVDTEVCATSVVKFSVMAEGRDDIAMLMVSCDLPFAHSRFLNDKGIKNVSSLSALRHAGFGDNYGVLITEGPLTGLFSRAVVVLDENNTVVHAEHIENIETEPDYEAAFNALGIDIET